MTAPTEQQSTGRAATSTTDEGTAPAPAPPLPDDSIFVPIDLEASLGRIEDHKQQQQQQHQQQQRQTDQASSSGYGSAPTTPGGRTKPTRTLSKAPPQAQHIIAPFPVVETPDELYERQKLTSTMMMGLSSSAALENSTGGVGDGCGSINNSNNNTFSSPIQPPPLFDCGAGEIDLRLPISAGPDGDEDDDCDRRDGVMNDEDMVVSRNDLDLVPNDDTTNSNNDDFETEMASVDEDGDNDDFSLSAEEANSLQDEDLHLETIQHDPVSFWETAATTAEASSQEHHHQQQQQFIPGSVSFTATTGQQQESSGMDWQ